MCGKGIWECDVCFKRQSKATKSKIFSFNNNEKSVCEKCAKDIDFGDDHNLRINQSKFPWKCIACIREYSESDLMWCCTHCDEVRHLCTCCVKRGVVVFDHDHPLKLTARTDPNSWCCKNCNIILTETAYQCDEKCDFYICQECFRSARKDQDTTP